MLMLVLPTRLIWPLLRLAVEAARLLTRPFAQPGVVLLATTLTTPLLVCRHRHRLLPCVLHPLVVGLLWLGRALALPLALGPALPLLLVLRLVAAQLRVTSPTP